MARTLAVIAAAAAIQESQGFRLDPHCNTNEDYGAILEDGNAPSWIAASAAMTKDVADQPGLLFPELEPFWKPGTTNG